MSDELKYKGRICTNSVTSNFGTNEIIRYITFAIASGIFLILVILLPVLYAILRSHLKKMRILKKAIRDSIIANKKPPLTSMLEARAKKPKQAVIFESDGRIWMPIATEVADGWRLRKRVVLLTPSFTTDIKDMRLKESDVPAKAGTLGFMQIP